MDEHSKRWHANVFLFEQNGETTARAVLDTGDTQLSGHGTARRKPGDTDVAEIGDELAVGRAFLDLGRRMVRLSANDIGALEGHHVRVHE